MPFYFISVGIAIALIYLNKVPLVIAIFQQEGKYDNNTQRDQQQRITGFGKRAMSAHYNSFESFPIFAISVLIAHNLGANPDTMNILAGTHILARVAYSICYVMDWSFVRSAFWGIGFFASLAILFLPILGL